VIGDENPARALFAKAGLHIVACTSRADDISL
jgi:hypothetical protein